MLGGYEAVGHAEIAVTSDCVRWLDRDFWTTDWNFDDLSGTGSRTLFVASRWFAEFHCGHRGDFNATTTPNHSEDRGQTAGHRGSATPSGQLRHGSPRLLAIVSVITLSPEMVHHVSLHWVCQINHIATCNPDCNYDAEGASIATK